MKKKSFLAPVGVGAVMLSAVLLSGCQQKASDTMEKNPVMEKSEDAVMEKSDDAMMKKEEGMMKEEGAMMEKTEEKMTEGEAMMKKESRYVPFTPEVMASAADTRRVLFFYANWCPNCKSAEESFSTKTSQIPEDVTLIRVNYKDTDTDQAEKDLAQKYGITYQHTFVQVDAQGNEVKKWNGGEIEELLKNVK